MLEVRAGFRADLVVVRLGGRERAHLTEPCPREGPALVDVAPAPLTGLVVSARHRLIKNLKLNRSGSGGERRHVSPTVACARAGSRIRCRSEQWLSHQHKPGVPTGRAASAAHPKNTRTGST